MAKHGKNVPLNQRKKNFIKIFMGDDNYELIVSDCHKAHPELEKIYIFCLIKCIINNLGTVLINEFGWSKNLFERYQIAKDLLDGKLEKYELKPALIWYRELFLHLSIDTQFISNELKEEPNLKDLPTLDDEEIKKYMSAIMPAVTKHSKEMLNFIYNMISDKIESNSAIADEQTNTPKPSRKRKTVAWGADVNDFTDGRRATKKSKTSAHDNSDNAPPTPKLLNQVSKKLIAFPSPSTKEKEEKTTVSLLDLKFL